ncbi:demethylmenaquinone methyltransferase [Fusarium napiforme]|uniref:Demethylmenaquinone methyltransferase n=1 Tax=Fusarium napiforme TaxID=42672 RepID=A0A8H5IY27_9HYPO|nr:demethylmenaquinone methyltransferase [Fusarium napiforme]
MPPTESQSDAAQRMYTERAANYEDSWHPDYSKRFMELVPIKPGDRVLDLACGTGRDCHHDETLHHRIRLVRHNVTDLTGCPNVDRGSFDLILCSSAFVLFENPKEVVAHWREYLQPGGRVAIDITHEYNLRSGLLLEKSRSPIGHAIPLQPNLDQI